MIGAAIALTVVTAAAAGSSSGIREITARREAEQKVFTDAEIVDGFFKVTFGAEFRDQVTVDRIRKYDGPVRVFIDSRGKPDRTAQMGEVIADVRARIKGLDIATTEARSEANIVVELVLDRDLAGTIRESYGRERARKIQRSLAPQCLSGFSKDETFRIVRSEVIIVVDAGDFVFYDCAYEELLQALGPINDDKTVPWTMFNDDVSMGFFDVYDQYLLNVLYDPRIRPGMSREEVHAMIPQVLPQVREFIARTNAIAPR